MTKLCVFLHSGEYDRVHQGLSIAAAGAAAGRRVEVFFFWWALERLSLDKLDEPDFARADVTDRMECRQAPSLRALLSFLKESGVCTVTACTGSMAALGLTSTGMEGRVDRFLGWSGILEATSGVVDRFYL